ncbi:MAG: aminotransferase class V-fold PLP-dependent enzyme [Cytophagales bacterium]
MAQSRRSFIHKSLAVGSMMPLFSMSQKKVEGFRFDSKNTDESYWKGVSSLYKQNVDFINLESGYFSPSPESVKDYWINYVNEINESPSYYMRTKQTKMREKVRETLASYSGVSSEEICLTRNTTESMNIIIQGLKIGREDEILRTNLEYPNIIQALDMRERRYGTKIRVVDVPIHPVDQNEIVDKVISAVDKRTKILLISHMVFLNGQVFPVKEVCARAREMGLYTIVDGAHSFSHVDMDISDIGCDFYASSLHKWLGAPLGNGLLYVRKGMVDKLWPLYGDTQYEDDNIMKLEHLGTRPCSDQNGIIPAVEFNLKVGKKNKSKRLKSLQMRWANELKDHKNIIINTPLGEGQSFGIANVGVRGIRPGDLADRLFDEHDIFTVPIDDERGIRGLRVSPNLYSTVEDIDKFIDAMLKIAG